MSHIHPRSIAALAAALCALFAAVPAWASQETHQTGDDVEMHLDRKGVASVRHVLRYRVVHGPIRWLDVAGVNPSAELDPDVVVSADDGRHLGARLARRDDGTVRIELEDPKAVTRGTFAFDVRWRIDCVTTGALARDGAMWRLGWTSPPAVEGFDTARATLDLPAAPEAPRPLVPETGAVDESAVFTVRREAARDVLELVRPHVGRGETVAWAALLDPRAFPEVVDPRLRPKIDVAPVAEPDRLRGLSFAAVLGGVAVLFGLLVARKARLFAAACAAGGARPRGRVGLVPMPDGVRALAGGASLAAGVGLQMIDRPSAGSALVAVAVLVATLRAPPPRAAARGPGKWLVLRPDEAFHPSSPRAVDDDWLDGGTRAGRFAALAAVAVLAAVAALAYPVNAFAPWLVAIDAAVLVPLFAAGCPSDVVASGAEAGGATDRLVARWLEGVYLRLRVFDALRVAPWARVVSGGSAIDELRLLVLPRAVMPGMVGIEIGCAASTAPLGWVRSPEVLVRVLEGTAAALRLARVTPQSRRIPGRRPDERVVRLLPRSPTRASTVALARELAEALTDRRTAAPPPWEGPVDRRVPPAKAASGPVPQGTC